MHWGLIGGLGREGEVRVSWCAGGMEKAGLRWRALGALGFVGRERERERERLFPVVPLAWFRDEISLY